MPGRVPRQGPITLVRIGFVVSTRRGVGAQSQSSTDRSRKHRDSHPNSVRSRHSEFGHSVEDVACKSSLDRLPIRITRLQSVAQDLPVAHERVLGTGLLVVARLLLPLASPDFGFEHQRLSALLISGSCRTSLGRAHRNQEQPAAGTDQEHRTGEVLFEPALRQINDDVEHHRDRARDE